MFDKPTRGKEVSTIGDITQDFICLVYRSSRHMAVQLVKVSAVVLNFIAVFVALGAVYILWSGSAVQGIVGLIAAFLLSPFGLQMFSIVLLGQIQRFRYWLQDSVYE